MASRGRASPNRTATSRAEPTSYDEPTGLEAKGRAQDRYQRWDGTGFYTLRVSMQAFADAEASADALAGAAQRFEIHLEGQTPAPDGAQCAVPA